MQYSHCTITNIPILHCPKLDLLTKMPCCLSCSLNSLKSDSSTLGLFGGDFGEAEGVFFVVEETDLMGAG